MAKAGKKYTPTRSKAGSSNWLLIVEELFPRWRDRLGSSKDAKDELKAFLRDPETQSAKHRVDSGGKEIPGTSRYVDSWVWQDPDRLLLVPDADGGVDHLVVDFSDYEDVYWDDYSPGWRWEFYVRALDVERWEKLYPALAAPPPALSKELASTKASKSDGSAKASRKPSSAQKRRDAAIQNRLDNGDRPPSNVTWPKFCQVVRAEGDGFIGNPKKEKYKRGFTDDTIEDVTRELMKSLAL